MTSVLIVAGERMTRTGCESIVAEAGYAVCGSARSTADALHVAQAHVPDMALIDIQVGANDEGMWIARELADRFGTRLVLMTETPDEHIVGAASLLGAAAVLRKTVEPRAIVSALDEAAKAPA
jgi:DNA-binding NarL/FixJ family response regulator